MYHKIEECRLCSGKSLERLINLGQQSFTGIFSKSEKESVPAVPVELLKCSGCDLVQLAHSYDHHLLYGDFYGYRSGLNRSMVKHLQNKVQALLAKYPVKKSGEIVLDIGSNDSTLLQAYPQDNFELIGIDPTGSKFKHFYPKNIRLIPDFFSAAAFRSVFGERKARVITSIAMFYDLEDPLGFAQEVAGVLSDDGVWVFEQSYLPSMLDQVSYDTICHEHLEYYALKQLKWITDRAGLKIVDLEFNAANGGSISLTAALRSSPYPECTAQIEKVLAEENRRGLSSLEPYLRFKGEVELHRERLADLLSEIRKSGAKVFGYGASTKGNVLLQYCGLSSQDLPFIAEVNTEKFGSFTPGTRIPIISEADAKALRPDYFLVLPWHFRPNILERERDFLWSGGKMIFPLPKLEVVQN